MYAILNQDNSIADFEKRDMPLSALIHPDFQHLYIEVVDNNTLKIGDVWNTSTQDWEIAEVVAPVVPESTPYQPTNAEVAQMISDLQADLLIAGVI